jgi:hypothetical protein
MHLEVFIGAVDVPDFSWRESPADTNDYAVSPRIISGAIPDSYRIFWEVLERTKDEKFVSKAIDWGTWAVRASKEELVEFLRSMYVKEWPDENWTELVRRLLKKGVIMKCEVGIRQMKDLIKLINGLDPDETYAIVAQES